AAAPVTPKPLAPLRSRVNAPPSPSIHEIGVTWCKSWQSAVGRMPERAACSDVALSTRCTLPESRISSFEVHRFQYQAGGVGARKMGSGSIVLADSDASERAVAANALRRAGFETVEVETGVDALNAALASGVGAVLLEVVLPEITGYEVCRMLREEL